MLPNISKSLFWRGVAQVREDVFEDAQLLHRVKVWRQAWKDQWQVDAPEPFVGKTASKTKALQDLEEAFPLLNAEIFKRAATSHKANVGVGSDRFHRKVPLDLGPETCGEHVVFLSKLEQCGYWPVQASTFLFLPNSEKCHE